MVKKQDDYRAFNETNFSNARSENESYEDYKKRLKQNEEILKVYFTVGRDNFKEMFPNGILEALKNAKAEKENAKELGERRGSSYIPHK